MKYVQCARSNVSLSGARALHAQGRDPAERATAKEVPFAAVFLDCSKCYERVNLDLLEEFARQAGFPSQALALALDMYKGLRRILVNGAPSEPVEASSGIPAGCGIAVAGRAGWDSHYTSRIKMTMIRALYPLVLYGTEVSGLAATTISSVRASARGALSRGAELRRQAGLELALKGGIKADPQVALDLLHSPGMARAAQLSEVPLAGRPRSVLRSLQMKCSSLMAAIDVGAALQAVGSPCTELNSVPSWSLVTCNKGMVLELGRHRRLEARMCAAIGDTQAQWMRSHLAAEQAVALLVITQAMWSRTYSDILASAAVREVPGLPPLLALSRQAAGAARSFWFFFAQLSEKDPAHKVLPFADE
eukprot:236855-Amphidinium_carterae.1